MKLSIIVVFHNMVREAERTLYTLGTTYQSESYCEDYEVIAVDNGSTNPLDPERVQQFGPQFSYHYLETTSVSPVDAVNTGVQLSNGELIGIIVDGARMASPGLIRQTRNVARLYANPFICSLSWHLGPDIQNRSMLDGYDQTREDTLLDSIDWRRRGYDLFTISTLAPSSEPGFLAPIPPECSWLSMRREQFLALGGLDSKFQSPGGGYVNHDFRNRALATPNIAPIVLLGEGVFHQFHGGVATNVSLEQHPGWRFKEEYLRIRGTDYLTTDTPAVTYFGTLPFQSRCFLG
jgi:glycosyltransferase involved in cell wall biosynthesis